VHATTPEERLSAQRQLAAVQRELREIAARREFRDRLRDHDREMFDLLSLNEQDQLRKMLGDRPDALSPEKIR
jgi:hypothetical protein